MSVDPKYLGMLGAGEAVSLFRQLLWAEAHRAGIGPALISVPGAISVPDGGVDAEINEVPDRPLGGLFYPGRTSYQIKTGAFSAGNDSAMKELFLKKDGKELNDRVRTCFEKGETFVAVLFGSDTPDRIDGALRLACQKFVGRYEPAYKSCNVQIFSQNQIAGFLNFHPALAAQAQMKNFPDLRTHAEWEREIQSRGALKVAPSRRLSSNEFRLSCANQ